MAQFYIRLPSNRSMNIYPENRTYVTKRFPLTCLSLGGHLINELIFYLQITIYDETHNEMTNGHSPQPIFI